MTATLAPRERKLLEALEQHGFSLEHPPGYGQMAQVAATLGVPTSRASRYLADVRKRLQMSGGGGVGRPRKEASVYVQTGLLPEAPVLPLGCRDARVIARCQRRVK